MSAWLGEGIGGKTFFLDVSESVLEETSIWTGELCKADTLRNVGGRYPVHWGPK